MERKDKKTNDGYLNSDSGFVSFVSVTQRRNDIKLNTTRLYKLETNGKYLNADRFSFLWI